MLRCKTGTIRASICCSRSQPVSPSPVVLLGVIFVSRAAEQLKGPLEEYVNKRYPGLVKIVRNQKREGLIRARIEGWKVATAEVTGFFDAHVEFTPSW